jgi:hypothetical protein
VSEPQKPTPRFKVGDVVTPFDEWRPVVVAEVVQELVGDEWREYVGYKHGAGNADLYRHAWAPTPKRSTGG